MNKEQSHEERLDQASDKKTDTSILDILADDKDNMIVEEVANNENTLGSTLEKLSNHSSQQVLLNVVNNPNTTDETLLVMFGTHQYKWVNDVVKKRLGVERVKVYLSEKSIA